MAPRAIAVFASLALVAFATAQTPSTGEELDRQVQEMRRQMVEGKVYKSHVRVTVRLRNGNRILGVVKDGSVVERVNGMRFVAAEKDEPGAGIRLYYWNGSRNYVFLTFAEIENYRINERLTSDQLVVLEREAIERENADKKKQLDQQQTEAAKAAAQGLDPAPTGESKPTGAMPLPPSGAPAGTPPATGGDPATGEQTGVAAELQQLYALVRDYPPSAGWGEKRRDEIVRKKSVVGANPTAAEQKFVDRYADWVRACQLFGVGADAKKTEEPTTEEGGRRRSRR